MKDMDVRYTFLKDESLAATPIVPSQEKDEIF
jgi:hypothetical protein